MCGITGIIKPKGLSESDLYRLQVLANQMSSRGKRGHGFSMINVETGEKGVHRLGHQKNHPDLSINNSFYLSSLFDCAEAVRKPHIAFAHERYASTLQGGTLHINNIQPIYQSYGDNNENYIVLMHNGTIRNADTLYEDFFNKKPNKDWSDSYILTILLYNEHYQALSDYIGTATLIWYNSKLKKTFIWRGESPQYENMSMLVEERPLYIYTNKESLYFASTEKAFDFAIPNIDSDKVFTPKENELYTISDKSILQGKIVFKKEGDYSRDHSHQEESYYGGRSYNYDHFPSYSNKDYGWEDEETYKSSTKTPELVEDSHGYIKPHESINYPANYELFIRNKHYGTLADFKDTLNSDRKINMWKGLYYFNGHLMHSSKPVYASEKLRLENPNKYQNLYAPFIYCDVTDTVRDVVLEKYEKLWFFHGLLCNNYTSFLELESNEKTLTPSELSQYLQQATNVTLIVGEDGQIYFNTGKDLYYKGELVKDQVIENPFPYCEVVYRKGNFVVSKANYYLSKLLFKASQEEFDINAYNEIINIKKNHTVLNNIQKMNLPKNETNVRKTIENEFCK